MAASAGAGTTAVAMAARAKTTGAVATGAAGVGARPGLELPVGAGEDCRTLGQKLCPPRVFIMAALDKEKTWRGWEEERFQK